MTASSHKNRFTFEWSLVASFLVIGVIGAYESLMQSKLPSESLLEYAHSFGYLKVLPVVYEAGKGLWLYLGWIGSAMMLLMMLYSVRKRARLLHNAGSMRRWLNAHMFLGIVGPLLVTFHTTFNYHGIVATSYWCMVATVCFGLIGRYIYIQIPRSINGAELGAEEIDLAISELDRRLGARVGVAKVVELTKAMGHSSTLDGEYGVLRALLGMVGSDIKNFFMVQRLRSLRLPGVDWKERSGAIELVAKKAALVRKRNLLKASHTLFHYWHVLHVPLAIVMFLIMFLHIAIYLVFSPNG